MVLLPSGSEDICKLVAVGVNSFQGLALVTIAALLATMC